MKQARSGADNLHLSHPEQCGFPHIALPRTGGFPGFEISTVQGYFTNGGRRQL